MADVPSLPPASFDELRRLRPEPEEGFARRVGIGGILCAVFGAKEERPRVGRYVVLSKVAEGGMGVVYRGVDPDTQVPVAIKLLHRAEAKERSRFELEAEILRALVHPAIVQYLEHGVADDGAPYLAMQWLEGCSLSKRLGGEPLPVADALRLALAVAEGLGAAHAAGIVHRDLKPSNLFLCGERLDDVRIIDFGIARSSHRTAGLTSTGSVLGTPCYMAPEQIGGKQDVRTDVYGLGATLFECLTGRPPFVGDEPGAVLLAVLAEPVPHLGSLRKDVPAGVDALVGRMLAKEAAERPVDMRAVITELADLLANPLRSRPGLTRQERRPQGPLRELPAAPGEFVGRLRERGVLRGVIEESVAERTCSVVLLRGEAGIGKSALLDVFASEVTQGKPPGIARVLRARASSEGIGMPFGVLAELLRSQAAVPGPPGPSSTLASLLQQLDTLEDGVDLRACADQLRLSWFDLLRVWTDEGAVLIIVDDAHKADLATLRYLEHGLGHVDDLGDRALVVVAAQRPGTVCDGLRGALPGVRGVAIELGPLGDRSTLRLAAAWSEGEVDPAVSGERARLSAGNPSHLRELCKTADFRSGASASLAGLVWARLSRLDPDARRVLRAASIVGRRFSTDAVLAVLGAEGHAGSLDRRVLRLVEEGLLRPAAGTGAFEFESELVHLGARELCTEADLRNGHQAMAQWLRTHRRGGAAAIAQHLAASGDEEAAAQHFVAAARMALAGEDMSAVDVFLGLASRHAQTDDTRGHVDALRAEAAFWRGDMPACIEAAERSMRLLPQGGEAWFRVASLAISASGQSGANDGVRNFAATIARVEPADAGARDARIVGMCRALMQLDALAEAGPASTLGASLAAVAPARLGADARAWILRVEGHNKAFAGFGAIDDFVAAHRAHVEANDPRSATQVGLYLGSYLTWSGAWELARERIDEALRTSRRLGAAYLEMWARYTDCKLRLETMPPDDASAALAPVIEEASGSPRILSGALVYAALAAHRGGDFAQSIDLARRARAVHQAPAVTVPAAAAECRALIALGRLADASALEVELSAAHADLSRIVEHRELIHLAVAELHHARGNGEAARVAMAEAKQVIEQRAQSLSDPFRRNEYLARPHIVVRTLELSRAWSTP